MSRPLLEVISTSPRDSATIQDCGADRIELVSALEIGGITPSLAVVRRSLEAASIKTMVMVRHHNQGFVLGEGERELLVEEASGLLDMGCRGIVLGALTPEHTVDQRFLEMLAEQVPMGKVDVTFHKAIDQAADLLEGYAAVRRRGIGRVLTQGGRGKVQDNLELLRGAMKVEGVRTLVGGGVTLANIKWIVDNVQPPEVHIGTCVREGRYGAVSRQLLGEFVASL